LIPGWRLGWLIFQDSFNGSIQAVKKGAQRLAQVVLGASRLAQVVIPAVLDPPNVADVAAIAQWKENFYTKVENQAALLCGLLKECQGLEVIQPRGAMYAMVKIHTHLFDEDISDDISFMKLLLEEENIVVLPGRAFGLDQEQECDTPVFRVVFCAPEDVLRCASERISSFCSRHVL
jgi:tyrosine aminotransferase